MAAKAATPGFVKFRYAQLGVLGQSGKLPPGWSVEHWNSVTVEDIDTGPSGPAITVSANFNENQDAKFYSFVIADYIPVVRDDLLISQLELTVQRSTNIASGFMVMREWIAGGEFVGQATRAVAMRDEPVVVNVGRSSSGENRVFQPLLTFQRETAAAGGVTIKINRIAMGTLYQYPIWANVEERA